MKEIFPSEIIETSVEHHFARFSRKSNLLYFSVLLLFVGAVCSLFFIQTEITVQSRGILRSSSEAVTISSPVIAEIIKCDLNENEHVQKGDTLLWLNSKKLDENIEHLNSLIRENNMYLSDISKILENKYTKLETELFVAQHALYRQKLAEFDLVIRTQKLKYTRSKTLFENKVIAPAEMEEQEFAYSQAVEQKHIYVRTSRKEWERLAVNYRLEIKKYYNEIASLENEKKNYYIIAPVSGHITNYDGAKTGSYLTTGQSIAFISPDSYIIAELLVLPQDVGYLQEEMPVLFQVDAYNYNQWGLATGSIIDISNEIHVINSTPYFKVRCGLNQKELSLKNGYKGRLKKGLTTTARFKVTKRTLAQLLIDKTDNWLNPNIIKE
ncbi:MAG: HlyD family secretion protein [Bacteroidota bacterium]